MVGSWGFGEDSRSRFSRLSVDPNIHKGILC